MINITTTHTITCTDAPVQEVYDELEVRFPSINPLARELRVAQSEMKKLTRERDEVQKRLEESRAVKEKLMADNKAIAVRDDALDGAFETQQMRINRLERKLKEAEEAILAAGSRPALPEGMRIAEHEKYGRCVVSPKTDRDGECFVFYLSDKISSGWDWSHVYPSTLTFLDSDPEPEPLPKPEDCKVGDLFVAKCDGEEYPVTRMAPTMSGQTTIFWLAYEGAKTIWFRDDGVTLLARLLPDRKTCDDLV